MASDAKLTALPETTTPNASDVVYISNSGVSKKVQITNMVTKTFAGLGNVDNTSDANKPVSSATQSALNLKANLASPTFTGTVSGIDKTMVGLGNVANVDTTSASNISSGTLDGDRLPAMSTTKKGAVPMTGTPSGKYLKDDGTWATVSGTGDVLGPASSTTNHIPQFSDTGGKTLKDGLGVVTSVGSPGADTNIPTEAAVRAAISTAGGGDFSGPASSVTDNFVSFAGITGKVGKDSGMGVATVNGKKAYHGIVSRSTVSPLPTTLTTTTFTLGATATPISYYYQGTLVTVSSDKTTTLAGTAGLYYIYFNAATGNLLNSTVFPGVDYTSNVIIASVNWNGSNLGLVNDERHNYKRCTDWHTWAHKTIGARYASGLTLTHNSGTGAAASFNVTAGEIFDEDIDFTISDSGSFPTPNAGRLFYQSGASVYSFVSAVATTPGYLGANNRPNYVNSTGYALTQMTSAANRYINVFVYATTDVHTPIYFMTETIDNTLAGNNGYTSVTNARAAAFPNLSAFGLSPEMKPIYRLIWRADGVLQAIDTTQDDYRTVSSLPMSAGTVSTNASAVSFTPYGNIASTTVQTAIQELDDEKAALAGSVSQSFGASQIELGAASDTTISRSAAGVIAVEGVVIPSISSTNTLTNKRITPRVGTTTSSATPTINTDDYDAYDITALSAAITSFTTNLTGTPTNFQKLIIRIKDDGTARAIAWGTSFVAGGVALPTTTVISKILTVGFIYNTANSLNKWQCIASAQEA